MPHAHPPADPSNKAAISPTGDFVCHACHALAPADLPFACPERGERGMAEGTEAVDHLLELQLPQLGHDLVLEESDNPFLRYRHLLYGYRFGRARAMGDRALVDLIDALDEAVSKLEGHGFMRSEPHLAGAGLTRALDLAADPYVLDETGNVGGSHKGRHLMEVMIFLKVAETLGLGPSPEAPLAIASCGNAALAAAIIAKAGKRELRVFVPTWAEESVLGRLRALGAKIETCPRIAGEAGDPCTARFREAVEEGAVPFSCQGPDNGLAVSGGQTLGFEIAEGMLSPTDLPTRLDRIFVQVGGGALASGVIGGLTLADGLGTLTGYPIVHAVQSQGCHPLVRAYDRLVAHALDLSLESREMWTESGRWSLDVCPNERAKRAARVLATDSSVASLDTLIEHAAHHRDRYMWPWEQEPRSAATGILDDETYDWLAIVRAMLETGGFPIIVDEAILERTRLAVRAHTPIAASSTGVSGLAGLLSLSDAGLLSADERCLALLTGIDRERAQTFEAERAQ